MRSESGTMTVEKGYKVTEVGVIPKEWELNRLSNIAEVKGGKRIPKGEELVDTPTAHPYIRVSDMVMGGVDESSIKYVPDHVWSAISRYTISQEDIFISVAGTLGIVGKIPEYLDGSNLTENADKICCIQCHRDYLLYYLQSETVERIIENERTLCAQPKLAIERIKQFPVLLPPLPEQEKIAEVLSTVDEHIGETEDLIEQTETLKKGMMQRLLTRGIGHTEFKDTEIGRIPVEWDVVSIAHLGTVSKGKGVNRDSIQSEGFPCVRYGEIYTTYDYVVRKCYSYISDETAAMSTPIRMGDLLFTGSGETVEDIGKAVAYMLDQPGYAGGDILILHPNSSLVVPLFLSFQWDTQIVRLQRRRSGQGASIVHLYPDALKRIQVALPPLSEQRQIASILTTIDDRIEEHRSKLEALTRLKSGLMQQLLTGKTRVRV